MTERTKPWGSVELAKAASVTDAYIRRLCGEGKLDCYKVGRDWLIPPEVGEEWLQQRRKRRRHKEEAKSMKKNLVPTMRELEKVTPSEAHRILDICELEIDYLIDLVECTEHLQPKNSLRNLKAQRKRLEKRRAEYEES